VKNACQEIQVKPGIFYECAPLWDKNLKDALKGMRTTENIYRNPMNIVSLQAVFSTYKYNDWDFFCLVE
jgi:hypothetical protein